MRFKLLQLIGFVGILIVSEYFMALYTKFVETFKFETTEVITKKPTAENVCV